MKNGFTLVELMFVIFLICIFSVFSISGVQQLFKKRSYDNTINALKHSLETAAGNSLSSGYTTIACPSLDQRSCVNSPDWTAGWIIYNDKNESHQLDNGEKAFMAKHVSESDSIILLAAAGNSTKIIFYPNGRLWPNGHFSICNPLLNRKHTITLAMTGRIRISEVDVAVCE